MSAVVKPQPATALYEWLRSRRLPRMECRSDVAFAFTVSALWLVLYNVAFWRHSFGAMWRPSLDAVAFFGSLGLLTLALQALLLLLAPTRWLMRAAASAFTVVAAGASHFISEYGVLMNEDMLRNALQTDAAEVSGLLNHELVLHLLLLGALPAWLIWRVALPPSSWVRALRRRLAAAVAALIVAAAAVAGCSAEYAVYFRAHKPIRYELSPAAPVLGAAQLARDMLAGARHRQFKDLGGVALRVGEPAPKPLVLFVVIGETARAANFQLGGYERATTPRLASASNIVYFSNVAACGTSTATSVPCMFSPFGRSDFNVDESAHFANVLDSLVDADYDVEWRENNAGCKGVCARVRTINYREQNAGAPGCAHGYCYDEVMLAGLERSLRTLRTDTAFVFHQIGSHGPAYSQRYPATFERFQPACRSNELHTCSAEELRNVYDNTIAYTDHILAQQIDLLQTAADAVDGALIYVSDHGESLGENGVYLHGMPYALAPRVQKHVPMLIWTSAGYRNRMHLDETCLRRRAAAPLSHDSLYHTILGAAQVRDAVYDSTLDVLSSCRTSRAADHE